MVTFSVLFSANSWLHHPVQSFSRAGQIRADWAVQLQSFELHSTSTNYVQTNLWRSLSQMQSETQVDPFLYMASLSTSSCNLFYSYQIHLLRFIHTFFGWYFINTVAIITISFSQYDVISFLKRRKQRHPQILNVIVYFIGMLAGPSQFVSM